MSAVQLDVWRDAPPMRRAREAGARAARIPAVRASDPTESHDAAATIAPVRSKLQSPPRFPPVSRIPISARRHGVVRHLRQGYVAVKGPLGHPRADRLGNVLEHILVVERALGKHLAKRHRVHHVNEDKADNRPANLVVCEDHGYHMLLHQRMRAMEATGDPNAIKCCFCKQYGAPSEMDQKVLKKKNTGNMHRACATAYARERKSAKRELHRLGLLVATGERRDGCAVYECAGGVP